MPEEPAVSVLIPVHNGLPFLESALRSIMEQTLREIEIVVVDDASTDATPEVLARLAAEDPRIRIERLGRNRGIIGALNHGLELVRAPLVARMDADDIAEPMRLAVQKAYLDVHPEITMVTASVRRMTSEGRVYRARGMALDDFAVRWMLRIYQCLMHPTYLFRRNLPDGTPVRYHPDWKGSEDYEISTRILNAGSVVCLSDVLLDYRVHGSSITGTRSPAQNEVSKRLARRMQEMTLPADLAGRMETVLALQYDRVEPTGARLATAARELRAVIDHDVKARPDLECWMKRQAAVLLLDNARRAGRGTALARILRHAPDFLVHGGLRLAERRLEGRTDLLCCQPQI